MLDPSKAKKEFGFEAKTPLEESIAKMVDWFKKECAGS